MLRIIILFITVFGSTTLFAQASISFNSKRNMASINKDTLIASTDRDTLISITDHCVNDSVSMECDEHNVIADSALYYRLILQYRDSIHRCTKQIYKKDAFKFKHNSFQEKMKEPWIGDILRNIFFR